MKHLILKLLLISPAALCVPVEGFEVFGLQHAHEDTSMLFTQAAYVNPSWLSDYEELGAYASLPVLGNNYFTFGMNGTIGNRFGDRDAYFFRYDQTWLGQSFSLKLLHRDTSYLQTGQNTLSIMYNACFYLFENTQVYVSFGMNYKANLNTWNSPTWSPISFNSEDREYYFEAVLGWWSKLSDEFYYTVDLNNRDAFNSYGLDNTALDVTLNYVCSDSLTLRFTSSTRFSAFWVGTADIGTQSFMLGAVLPL